MRFLIDASLSPAVVQLLNDAGHQAVHVGETLRLDASDAEVVDLAAADERVIVSADTDFGAILARRGTAKPSLILFRRHTGRRPAVGQLAAPATQALVRGISMAWGPGDERSEATRATSSRRLRTSTFSKIALR